MKLRRRGLIAAVAALYAAGLVWGYFRLPWAAVKGLSDYELIAKAPAVSFANMRVSPSQLWYLRRSLRESPAPVVPRVTAAVGWYALALARVSSGFYVGPLGAESRDSLYLCLFGAWIPVYTYSHPMA